jgi:hypothetical protein
VKTYTKEEIKEKILTNRTWLERGLIAIYNRQTEDEKEVEETKHLNKIGFSGAHAYIMSSFARQLITRKFLTPKQTELTKKILVHYVGQLTSIANEPAEKVTQQMLMKLKESIAEDNKPEASKEWTLTNDGYCAEDSSLNGNYACPKCRGYIGQLHPVYDNTEDHEIKSFDQNCIQCGTKLVIFHD